MSDLPSPLKSPVATACQLGPGLPAAAVAITLAPFIAQITTCPLSLCHRMSERPSPLKSPVPISCQLGPGLPLLAATSTPAPLTAQMLPSPLTFWNRMSELPSPLKSLGRGHDNGRPCACHAGPGLPRSPAAITL